MARKVLLFKVAVGPHVVPVYSKDGLTEKENVFGYTRETTKGYEIVLDESLEGPIRADTFIHELIELSCMIRELGLSHKAIQTLGTDLSQALKCILKTI